MGPRRSPRANIDQHRTSRGGKNSRWAERDRIAPVWKCDRPLNIEARTAMLIPAHLTNTDRPLYSSSKEKISPRFLHPDLHARTHSLLQARWISPTDRIRRDGFTSRGMETRVTATSGS
ncbi:hypothetical protein ACFW04_002584 [Cataglyphis niger]